LATTATPDLGTIILSGLFAAAVSLIVTVGLRLWQYERERWTARVDTFCDIMMKAAETGVEYWIEAGLEGKEFIDRKREIQILGYQDRLDGILVTFQDKFPDHNKREITEKLANFREALSGGAFQTDKVKSDLNRARDVQSSASEMFVYVRTAADLNMKPFASKYPKTGETA
jgi:hypothetical protein